MAATYQEIRAMIATLDYLRYWEVAGLPELTNRKVLIVKILHPSIFLYMLSPALRVALMVTGALHEDYSLSKFPPLMCVFAYRGGVSFSSRNSSILLTSTFTSPLKVTKGGLVPGARSCRSAGFLTVQFQEGTFSVGKASTGVTSWRNTCGAFFFYLFRSTVVTLKMTPLSHRIMKSLWEKGQLPMLSPSLPACTTDAHSESSLFSHFPIF